MILVEKTGKNWYNNIKEEYLVRQCGKSMTQLKVIEENQDEHMVLVGAVV